MATFKKIYREVVEDFCLQEKALTDLKAP